LRFLADTVAIIRHFSQTGRIGETAKSLLQAADKGEHSIVISMMSVAEILYLSEKGTIPLDLRQLTDRISTSGNYRLIDIDLGVLMQAQTIRGLELHDRLIVATAQVLGVPMLTSDKLISESGLVEVVWK
jgi:PIN domain nuclease of toxin-antitoxin system